jgi:hypothetical protein
MNNLVGITVTLFGDDSEFDARRHFRDAVASALQRASLGKYIGGGSMVTDDANYDIDFEVADENRGFELIRDVLRSERVGACTEMTVSGNRRYKVYDDSRIDLGPRCRSANQTPSPDSGPEQAGGDFLANLKNLTEEARRKYVNPEDRNTKA